VIPLRPIATGERLTWNYLPYWKWLWPTHLRQEALREGWDFLCACERCVGHERETTMAFVCPRCDKSDLCPARPCAAAPATQSVQDPPSVSGSCCSQGHGHCDALGQIAELRCDGCALQLCRGEFGGLYSGYFDRCLAQEEAVFALPWRGVLGRDPNEFRPVGEAILLSERHWLRADHASHILENAPAIFQDKGLAGPGVDASIVSSELKRLAEAADCVEAALIRLLRHKRATILPELSMYKALATGEQRDWDVCGDVHRRVYEGCRGALGTIAASERLLTSRCGFVDAGLRLEPAAMERLALQLDGAGASVGGVSEDEVAHVNGWIGAAAVCADGGRDAANGLGAWVLRRMWLCPGYGASAEPDDAEQSDSGSSSHGKARKAPKRAPGSPPSREQSSAHKKPAATDKSLRHAGASTVRRKPAADKVCSVLRKHGASEVRRKPAAADVSSVHGKPPAARSAALHKRPSACPAPKRRR